MRATPVSGLRRSFVSPVLKAHLGLGPGGWGDTDGDHPTPIGSTLTKHDAATHCTSRFRKHLLAFLPASSHGLGRL